MKKRAQAKMANGIADAWQSKPHRFFFFFCAVCLSLYLSYAIVLAQSPIFESTAATALSLLGFAAFAALLFVGMMWSSRRLAKAGPVAPAKRARLSVGFFAVSAGISLFILAIAFAAYYPGGVSYDVYNQWEQAHSGLLNAWHPVFHTWLMQLGISLWDNYAWLVLSQMAAFALALAYLMTTLRAWGLRPWILLVAQGLIVASNPVGNTLMYVWKDNAMTIGVLVLSAQAINCWFSRGEWLGKTSHAVAVGLALAGTTLVRHNAVLYTLPLLACILLAYRPQWKQTLAAGGTFALCCVLVMGPFYGMLDVVYPKNTVEESVGVPMTVLCDTKIKNEEALDEEARVLLDALLTREQWQSYRLGDYNSIKFLFPRELIASQPVDELLGMTLRTMQNDPRTAFEAINAVTGLVWGVGDEGKAVVGVRTAYELGGASFQNSALNQWGGKMLSILRAPYNWFPLSWIFQNIGVQFAALLLCTLLALYRSGTRALSLGIPTLLYHLGTMLLLCGNDARFFHFSMVASIPVMLVLLRRPAGEKTAGENLAEQSR